MKQTPLHAIHVAAGATMVDYAGWDMPVSYAGTVSEVNAVRTSAGIFDVSHMGEFRVIGSDALEFVQSISTNDASLLSPGNAQYALLLDEKGGVIDDIIVYRHDVEIFVVVVNAGCLQKDWDWFTTQSSRFGKLAVADESDATSLIALQGPKAVELLSRVFGAIPSGRFQFLNADFGTDPVVVSRTGYTGEDGVEIFCGNRSAPALWEALSALGAIPAGLGARDVLRLEAGYPLYGHELDSEHSPFESGAGWAVKLGKPDFVGRQVSVGRKRDNTRKLVGIKMLERAIPRADCVVLDTVSNGEIGVVLSGTYSPTLQQGIATTRLPKSHSDVGAQVVVEIRGRRLPAEIVPLPFYRNGV